MIAALWSSPCALSAGRYAQQYTEHGDSPTYTDVIGGRLAALEAVGVVKVDRVEDGHPFYVLRGVNADEAVRRLELETDRRPAP